MRKGVNKDGFWVQLNGNCIVGIDGDAQKKDALDALNSGLNKGCGIRNSIGKVIYST